MMQFFLLLLEKSSQQNPLFEEINPGKRPFPDELSSLIELGDTAGSVDDNALGLVSLMETHFPWSSLLLSSSSQAGWSPLPGSDCHQGD